MNDVVVLTSAGTRPGIDAAERARRTASIDYARGSMRLEGFVLSADVEALNQRYIDGEIDSAQHSAAVLAL